MIYTEEQKERFKTQDERQDHFKPKTDNICDHCHWMQFNISDKVIPCKRCRHYAG